jgi:uncharacterized protein YjbJ (UPF0337 family)
MTSPDGSSAYTPISVRAFNRAVEMVEQLIAKIRAELNRLIGEVDKFIARTQDSLNWFESAFEFFTGDVEEALGKIRELLEKGKGKVNELLEKAEKSVEGSVPVGSLFSRAFEMGDTVLRPLSGLHGDMTGSGKIDFWRGPAKITYEKRVGDQQDAVDNATDKVKSLATYLGGGRRQHDIHGVPGRSRGGGLRCARYRLH